MWLEGWSIHAVVALLYPVCIRCLGISVVRVAEFFRCELVVGEDRYLCVPRMDESGWYLQYERIRPSLKSRRLRFICSSSAPDATPSLTGYLAVRPGNKGRATPRSPPRTLAEWETPNRSLAIRSKASQSRPGGPRRVGLYDLFPLSSPPYLYLTSTQTQQRPTSIHHLEAQIQVVLPRAALVSLFRYQHDLLPALLARRIFVHSRRSRLPPGRRGDERGRQASILGEGHPADSGQ
jgi:hypothetical protein